MESTRWEALDGTTVTIPFSLPAQCHCGHILEQFIVRVRESIYRPFTWCAFKCHKRVDYPDVRATKVEKTREKTTS